MTVGVQDASFTVNSGEIFVVMGLSGSGKSTLVRMLNRLIEPSSGRVLVDGKDITGMQQDELVKFRLHNMSMVFQSFALMPHLTVLENAAFGLDLARTDKIKQRERAMEALEQVGLSGWEDSYPKQLSGGMQQRVLDWHEGLLLILTFSLWMKLFLRLILLSELRCRMNC